VLGQVVKARMEYAVSRCESLLIGPAIAFEQITAPAGINEVIVLIIASG